MTTHQSTRCFLTLLLTGFLSVIPLAPASGQIGSNLRHTLELQNGAPQSGTLHGASVAIDGNLAVAGAPNDDLPNENSGVVKVYNVTTGALVHALTNPTPAVDDYFGSSVSITGNRLIAGAPGDDTGSNNAGSAYIYDFAGANPDQPSIVLTNPAPNSGDRFGASVASKGNYVAVGAPDNSSEGSETGEVYVYDQNSGTPTVPALVIAHPNLPVRARFGSSLAIDGSYLIVGAPGVGKAYVYNLTGPNPSIPLYVLDASNSETLGLYSLAVAISGSKVVVGRNNYGVALVFDIASQTPTVPTTELVVPESEGTEAVSSVAIDGNRVFVGNYEDRTAAVVAGRVFVFDLGSAVPSQAVLRFQQPNAADFDGFGFAIAVSGRYLFVGSTYPEPSASEDGKEYVFDLESETPGIPKAELHSPSPSSYDHFGELVAVSGSRVVVAAIDRQLPRQGAAIYVYDLASETPLVPVATISKPNGAGEAFGWSIAISGSRLVVSARSTLGLGSEDRVYVYDLAGANPATPAVVINKPSSQATFGRSVAIFGTRVAIGGESNGRGFVYVYDVASATPTTPIWRLVNPSTGDFDGFGDAVAIDRTRVLVGAPKADPTKLGNAYLYSLDNTGDVAPVYTFNSPSGVADDGFGRVVALSGSFLAISAPRSDTGANEAGCVYAYEFDRPLSPDAGLPSLPFSLNRKTIPNPSPASGDLFGSSLALFGNRLVVGCEADNTGATNSGSAYVYNVDGINPSASLVVIPNPGPAKDDRFGCSVAVSGNIVVVGASQNDGPTPDRGIAYVYDGGLDETTQAPAISGPYYSGSEPGTLFLNFTLNEAVKAGSVKLVFNDGSTNRELILDENDIAGGVQSLTFNPADPVGSSGGLIASGPAIPDGQYSVTLSYQDLAGNPPASSNVTTIQIDSVPPEISGTFAPLAFLQKPMPDYRSQAITADATLVTITQSPEPGSAMAVGTANVTLTARDLPGNMASVSFEVTIMPPDPSSAAVLLAGDNAPGAGSPDGPPADAKLTSFGLPAIDAEGNVAFVGKWSSSSGSGSALFVGNACVVKVGDTIGGDEGAKVRTISDPVVDSGKIAFVGTLTNSVGKPSSAVVSNAPTGTLAVLARAGTEAPATDGAKFKSFKAVAISETSVALFAQLAVGTGADRVTAANDWAVWATDATHSLRPVLREGQGIGERKIKTLLAFATGSGSAGQGRGWLTTNNGTPALQALAVLDDKSQAILTADLHGNVAFLSRSGPLTTEEGSVTVQSFGVPTINVGGTHAFLATLTGSGRERPRGIVSKTQLDSYQEIVRASDVIDGITIKSLKDPVLAADDGFAFSAVISGGASPASVSSLWWGSPERELGLLARCKTPAAGLTTETWKSFSSLAIAANRGPLFSATLNHAKGSVTPQNDAGVWAIDFEGALRLLFRTGDPIAGKTLKKFDVLSASAGSAGVTRSFNDAGQIVWRAHFTDKTSGIIVTNVP